MTSIGFHMTDMHSQAVQKLRNRWKATPRTRAADYPSGRKSRQGRTTLSPRPPRIDVGALEKAQTETLKNKWRRATEREEGGITPRGGFPDGDAQAPTRYHYVPPRIRPVVKPHVSRLYDKIRLCVFCAQMFPIDEGVEALRERGVSAPTPRGSQPPPNPARLVARRTPEVTVIGGAAAPALVGGTSGNLKSADAKSTALREPMRTSDSASTIARRPQPRRNLASNTLRKLHRRATIKRVRNPAVKRLPDASVVGECVHAIAMCVCGSADLPLSQRHRSTPFPARQQGQWIVPRHSQDAGRQRPTCGESERLNAPWRGTLLHHSLRHDLEGHPHRQFPEQADLGRLPYGRVQGGQPCHRVRVICCVRGRPRPGAATLAVTSSPLLLALSMAATRWWLQHRATLHRRVPSARRVLVDPHPDFDIKGQIRGKTRSILLAKPKANQQARWRLTRRTTLHSPASQRRRPRTRLAMRLPMAAPLMWTTWNGSDFSTSAIESLPHHSWANSNLICHSCWTPRGLT